MTEKIRRWMHLYNRAEICTLFRLLSRGPGGPDKRIVFEKDDINMSIDDILNTWDQENQNILENEETVSLPISVRTARIDANLTQQQLADASGVHVSQIKKLESGKIRPDNMTAGNLIALADTLNVDPRQLLICNGTGYYLR